METLELKNQELFNNFEAVALSEKELVEVNGGYIWVAAVLAVALVAYLENEKLIVA